MMQRRLLHIVTFCCLLMPAVVVHAQNNTPALGTLFTTPQEREYLDYLREDFLARNQANDFNINEDVPPIIVIDDVVDDSSIITEYEMTGFFSRSDGSHVAWINGLAIAEGDLPSNMAFVNSGNSLSLRIETDTGSFLLKPGQRLNTLSGEIREAYSRSPVQTPTLEEDTSQETELDTSPEDTVQELDNVLGSEGVIINQEDLQTLMSEASPEEIAILLETLQALQDAQ